MVSMTLPIDSFNRISLAMLPTPLLECRRLSMHLGWPRILVKRDDLTGPAGGGNKVRKLEFVIADALESGADCLVTMGVGQSNSARQIAGIGTSLGLDVHVAVITDRVLRDDDEYVTGGNALPTSLFGAVTYPCSAADDRATVLDEISGELLAQGRRPPGHRAICQAEGLILDRVYSGVGAAGLIEMVEQGRFDSGDTVVFIHTRGAPGLHAYRPVVEDFLTKNPTGLLPAPNSRHTIPTVAGRNDYIT
jgi:1-aminocyclopropane-1-carboxylate deaminase/D-cysteine desulfhydrase-like pyridoxal-dependent ACC family enzyme